ncbi:MAG: Peptidylprolyl isomerase [Fibrobacteres bacterium]|nr:Peptidylprolyl isomerase [Fibrobacterota bacterium]
MLPLLAACVSLIGLSGTLSGCKKDQEKATVLAQVGNSTLTLEELRESFPADYEQLIRREQYLDFIKRWMDDEAVYQQALKAKLENDPVVGRKLEKLRRKILIEEYLARENASEVFEPDEMAMNQYYEMHKEDFRRKAPEFKVALIHTETYKQAMDLRGKASRGDFLAVAATGSKDPAPESYASITFKKQSDFPPCLSNDIAAAGIGNVTLPIACPDGNYLVKVIEKQDVGSLVPFAEAKEEISGILIMERKDKLLDAKIAKYKEGLPVSYNLDQIPGVAAAEAAASSDAPASQGTDAGTAAAAPAGATPGAKPSPGQPASAPAASATARPAAAARTPASDPRLPHEPANLGGDPAAAMPIADPAPVAARPRPPRKRAPKPARAADSSDTRTAPIPAVETNPETTGQKPAAEENSNAQTPIQTP